MFGKKVSGSVSAERGLVSAERGSVSAERGSVSAESEKDVKVNVVGTSREKGDFGEKGNFKDEVTLKFDDGDELYVSTGFLKMASPVFTRMLESDFREKSTKVITLEGKDPDDFLELLWFLHPAIQKRKTETTVFGIIPLAEEYEIQSAISDGKAILNKLINDAVCPDTQTQNKSSARGRGLFGATTIEPSVKLDIDKNHCKSLCNCLKVLVVAVVYSYNHIEEAALVRMSKYPSQMYTKQLVHSNNTDINCFELYSNLSDKEKVNILKVRLDVQDVTCNITFR